MVYSFAKQSGGMARIRSDEGAGTTVSIFFPAVDEASSPIDKRGDGSVLERPGKETILVVEERTDVSELAGVILRDFGYQVLRAKDAREALNFLDDRNDIDLLLSDLVMPGDMTGVALAREARRRHPKMKALLTTGYVEASLERTDAGGWEFDVLNKPYGRLDLARKVRVILDGPTGAS
jgi:Response regulator containing CheY-like receiver, AAA-type ATPase, and DNA-binding domains